MTSWSVAGALLAVAPSLHAQDAKPSVAALRKEDAPVGAVRVFVSTDENDLLLTVAQPGKAPGIVRCYHRCSFWGLPGSYTLWATSPEREVLYETTLHVGKRTQFSVSSEHPDARTAGLITGILGPFTVGIGAYFVATGARRNQCDDCAGQGTAEILIGYGMFIAGSAATLGGWLLFATSGPSVDSAVDDQPIRHGHEQRLQLGLLPLPHNGWALGLSTQF
ncbi:MAG TPA: hypothetical protein VNW92_31495 [Polyangiaceae bacterium]|nr:hypothetical protein [Polyangiaceae bacterium]